MYPYKLPYPYVELKRYTASLVLWFATTLSLCGIETLWIYRLVIGLFCFILPYPYVELKLLKVECIWQQCI